MIGYVPLDDLLYMTLKEWELMIKGARHKRLDALEDLRLQAVMYARMTNGKDIKDINRKLEKERALINQTEGSYELDQKKKNGSVKRYVKYSIRSYKNGSTKEKSEIKERSDSVWIWLNSLLKSWQILTTLNEILKSDGDGN